MHRFALGCFGLAFATALIAAPADATALAVANPSFEEVFEGTFFRDYGPGASFSDGAPIPGWQNGGSSGQFIPGSDAGNFTTFSYIPDGRTTGWAYGSALFQTLAVSAVAGTTYTLSTQFGYRKDYFSSGLIELIVGGNTIAATGSGTQRSGDWATFLASYTATDADAGAPISIRLSKMGGDNAATFDDVLLSASVAAVPEPATWGLLIAGFGLVGAAARKRRTTTVHA